MKNAPESERDESVLKTSVCKEEKFQYCYQGQSQVFLRKFEGVCKPPTPISPPPPTPLAPPAPEPTPPPPSVVAASLTILSPNGGEIWVQGFKGSVFWNATNTTNPVTINLLKSGTFYRTLATNVQPGYFSGYLFQNIYPPLSAKHVWVDIPSDVEIGTDYTIEIIDSLQSTVRDKSNSSFSIIPFYNPVTIKGRFIDRFTKEPLVNTYLGGYDRYGPLPTAYTNSNGEFSFSVDTAVSESSPRGLFVTTPVCHKSLSASLWNFSDAVYATFNEFDLNPDSKYIPIYSSDVSLGEIKFWPAVTLYINSDIPVNYEIPFPEEGKSEGNQIFSTSHIGTYILPLDYNLRVKLTDQSGQVYYSPYIKLDLNYGCDPVTLKFSNGKFEWNLRTDVTPPVISDLSVSDITFSGATINWLTNEPADSQVDYGLTLSYGSSTSPDSSLAASHPVSLSGLSASTTYHYRIKSRDAAGNLTISADYTFTTAVLPTISVSLSASPSSGTAPLVGVDLTAAVSVNVSGNINYTFYCNRADSDTNITIPYTAKYDNVTSTTQTAPDVCNYINPGIYTVKVIAERGTLVAESRILIAINSPPLSTKFSIYDRVKATTTINVRAAPSVSATLVGTLPAGSLGTVIGGPVYWDGYWWWNVNYDKNLNGWTVEDYLEKLTTVYPFITILSPNGGEVFEDGKIQDITWVSSGVDTVNITLEIPTESFPGGYYSYYKTIASGIPASRGKYSWILGNNFPITPRTDYKIRITGSGISGAISVYVYDYSNNYFNIVSATISSP